MTPFSPQLQQHWQTVVDRLPQDFPQAALSPQAKAAMTFSDFLAQSFATYPQWLSELESAPPLADEWQHYADWLQTALADVSDETA